MLTLTSLLERLLIASVSADKLCFTSSLVVSLQTFPASHFGLGGVCGPYTPCGKELDLDYMLPKTSIIQSMQSAIALS